MDRRGVLDDDQTLVVDAFEAELGDCRRAVLQEPLLIGGVEPGARHHPRAVAGADLRLVGLDDEIERRRIDQALFREQRFERLDAQRGIREGFAMPMVLAHAPPRVGSSVRDHRTLTDAPRRDNARRPDPEPAKRREAAGTEPGRNGLSRMADKKATKTVAPAPAVDDGRPAPSPVKVSRILADGST